MRRLFIAIPLATIAFYATLYLNGFLQLRRARELVNAVEQLRVGEPLPKQPFGTAFRDPSYTPDRRCYVSASNLPFLKFWIRRGGSPPRLLVWNWWYVAAQVGLDQSGKVLDKELGINDLESHDSGAVGITVREDRTLYDPCRHPGAAMHPGYVARRQMRTGALKIDISPSAEQRLMKRVFSQHLDRLNSIKGCNSPGDIAPDAWSDALEQKEMKFDFDNCWHTKT